MTAPSPATLEREREKLYVTDAELIRRIGLPEKKGRALLHELDTKHPGFPQKQKWADNRRYWPKVQEYFDRMNGMLSDDAARLIPENRERTRLPRPPYAQPLRRA